MERELRNTPMVAIFFLKCKSIWGGWYQSERGRMEVGDIEKEFSY
jgi:hypothetical protein